MASSRTVGLAVIIAAVGHGERSVGLSRKLDPLTLAGLVRVGDERIRCVVLFAAGDGVVDLPDVLESGGSMHDLPRLRSAALARSVVHDGDARMQRMHDYLRSG